MVYLKYVLIVFVLAIDPDGGPKLKRAAADQEEKKRGLQWGDRWGREACENPQVYCGEPAVTEQHICPAVSTGSVCVLVHLWFFTHAYTLFV